MDPDYVEAVLTLTEKGKSEHVQKWFADRGFKVMPMQSGLLVSAPASQFEAHLGTNLQTAAAPVDLPIPADIRSHVAAFGVPRPRRYQP
jgi:hypothetical protein